MPRRSPFDELKTRVRDIEQWRELREPAQTLRPPGVRDILQAIGHLQTNLIKATEAIEAVSIQRKLGSQRDMEILERLKWLDIAVRQLVKVAPKKPKAAKRGKRVKR